MTRPLVILGTGGSAYDVLDIIEAINLAAPTWHVAGFLDDAKPVGSRHLDLPILGRLADANRLTCDHQFINAIGSDASFRNRPAIIAACNLGLDRFATLVHPLASVSARAQIGNGVYVAFGASVGGGVRIGNNVSLSPGVIIGHDSIIEDFALLAPGAIVSGFCRIESCAYIGAGAAIRQHVRVGHQGLVGLGAVVLRDVPASTVVVGNPAYALERSPRACSQSAASASIETFVSEVEPVAH
jgi:sugar O-acyltransferase (sialic acid O-acetyltransferase NeuD family)